MKITNEDVIRFLHENAEWWEQVACLFEQMSKTPAEVSAENENLWRLQGAAYHERSQLCESFLADLRASSGTQTASPAA